MEEGIENAERWVACNCPLALLMATATDRRVVKGRRWQRKMTLFCCLAARKYGEATDFTTSELEVLRIVEAHCQGEIPDSDTAIWRARAHKTERTVARLLRYNGELNVGWFVRDRVSRIPADMALSAVREVFGNPFDAPPPLAGLAKRCGFLGDDLRYARAIAKEIVSQRRFEDCGILADALEDAGVADLDRRCEGLVQHLREPGHALGCWALDWVLGHGLLL